VARDPTLAHGYFSLGVVYDKLGQPQQALAMYNQAVQLVPWYQPYLHNLAYQYVRLQDYDRAIAAYHKAQAVDDTFVLTHLELAQVYRQLGQLELARHAQQHAVALLDDRQVTDQTKNQQPWYFSHGAQRLPLDTLPRKQCYARWSLAVTLRLLGRTADAEQYQRKSCGVSAEEEAYIREWVEAESGMQR
jgi:tetratricopeptide (TPR) repeat protein